ncbi:N-acetylmuramidase domain-containing protein [Methylomonas koyamae]|uniref:N-acetylmuramidase domain-containing protein n=1 Tax=Methylomonas koyamae TaxID=702114 RepID=UPI00112EE80B|nr:N-acetylmuramidase domain-containing protein [Methylomonas koyamae]TPQ24257.1 peptidoglycan-binding protein [Methylomonas koyamae]
MNFQDQGRPLSGEGIEQVCNTLGVAQPAVWAVLSVETRGFGFLKDRRPQILFERHIFHNQTAGRFDSSAPDISDSKAGGYIGGAAEYDRLHRALGLDQAAALRSASWGIGQVMGFNFEDAGFATVDAMVAALVADENAQLLAMTNFIKANGLAGAMQKGKWDAFARGYNGPSFEKNQYDTRLAAAHAQYKVMLPDLGLRTAQAALLYLGFDPGTIDGVTGKRTRSAITAYQEKAGLPKTGGLDTTTESTLLSQAFPSA